MQYHVKWKSHRVHFNVYGYAIFHDVWDDYSMNLELILEMQLDKRPNH